jgi:alpha-methylacyl-CoA racemase
VYRCADGRWISVGAIEAKFFANLCRALGLEELAEAQYDDARQDELRSRLAEAFAIRDRDAWVDVLAPLDTCVAPVRSIGEVGDDPQFVARGAIVEAEHPDHGRFRQVGEVLARGDRA